MALSQTSVVSFLSVSDKNTVSCESVIVELVVGALHLPQKGEALEYFFLNAFLSNRVSAKIIPHGN